MSLASTPAAPAPPGLWQSVWKLLRLQALITFNNIRRAKLRRKIWYGILAVIVLGVLVGVFAGSWGLLSLLRNPEVTPYLQAGSPFGDLLQNIPSLVLTGAFFVLVVTSFGVLLQSLYLSGDMEFLLSAPVSIRAVFIAKLIEAILPDFGLVCLFGLPILFGLGVAGGFHVAYFPLVLLVFMALALAVSGLTSLLVMAVVRVVPARRVAELIGFFGAIVSIVCSQSGQLANNLRFSRGQFTGALTTATGLDAAWSPLSWAGHGLLGIAHGDWLTGAGLLAGFFVLTAVAFYLALITAERLYYTGWSRVQVGTRRRRSAARMFAAQPVETVAQASPMFSAPRRSVSLFDWLPGPTRAILAKDYHVLTRDLRNMSQIVTPLLFGIIYTLAITRTNRLGGREDIPRDLTQTLQSLTVYATVAISLFVSWGLLSRLALIGFSHEGRSYWLIKTSPTASRQILVAKFLVAYLPGLLLGWLFLAITSLLQHADIGITLYSAAMLLFSLAGAVGVNLSFGVTGVNQNWQNPRAMMRGSFGCLASLASMGYMVLIVAIFFGPPIGFTLLSLPEAWGRALGLVLGIAASLVAAILPPLTVLKRIDRIGEES